MFKNQFKNHIIAYFISYFITNLTVSCSIYETFQKRVSSVHFQGLTMKNCSKTIPINKSQLLVMVIILLLRINQIKQYYYREQ